MTAPRYQPPKEIEVQGLDQLVRVTGRVGLASKQLDMLRSAADGASFEDIPLYCAGDLNLLFRKCVSVVGTREVSSGGYARARRLSRELVECGVVVVSGLARGVDYAAHTSAIDHNGKTIAVIGTPLNKAYPAENAGLQMEIYNKNLLISPFREDSSVFKSNFPKRNRVMAALSDATVIIEASDTSGTLHQAAECLKLGRWLFIARSVVDDKSISWPAKFLSHKRTRVLSNTSDLLETLTVSI